MSEEVGFVTMAKVERRIRELPRVGVGLLGYAFMGKAHTHAWKSIPTYFWPPPAIPRLVAICGRRLEGVSEAARRYGYEKYYTDWHKLVEDPDVEVFDNCGPNNVHAEPCIAAAEAGKHVICEKPLARNSREAKMMLDAVRKAGVKPVSYTHLTLPTICSV